MYVEEIIVELFNDPEFCMEQMREVQSIMVETYRDKSEFKPREYKLLMKDLQDYMFLLNDILKESLKNKEEVHKIEGRPIYG